MTLLWNGHVCFHFVDREPKYRDDWWLYRLQTGDWGAVRVKTQKNSWVCRSVDDVNEALGSIPVPNKLSIVAHAGNIRWRQEGQKFEASKEVEILLHSQQLVLPQNLFSWAVLYFLLAWDICFLESSFHVTSLLQDELALHMTFNYNLILFQFVHPPSFLPSFPSSILCVSIV